MAAPLILVEAQPRNAATGAVITTRLAGGGGAVPYHYGGEHWRAGLTGLPTIVASIDFDGTDLGTGSVPQAMSLDWAPSSASDLAAMAALHWIDAVITVRIGPEGALPPVVTTGKVIETSSDGGALTISLSDPAADLKQPILSARFAGTGGIEGPAEWEGQIKRRAWGRVWNLEGEPIDAANNVYCFGDPAHPWAEFVAVRDKGAAASGLTTLAWAGSVAATFAALQAAEAPIGGGVVCPSIACVKWWTQPAGTLCADIRGEIGSGYADSAAAIAQRIAATVSTVAFAPGTVEAAIAARPAPAGWLAADESGTAAAALDALLGDASLLWLLDNDLIVLRQWAWGAPVAAATSLDASRRQAFKPVSRRRLGYRRNQTVMTRDALAGIVLATDVVLGDGSTAENLQSAVQAAQDAADAAIAEIVAISSDSVLSRGSEKQRAAIDYQAIVADHTALAAQYSARGNPAGIATQSAEAAAAVAALTAYLGSLVPSWTDIETDTPIAPVAWTSNWGAAYDKVARFRAALTGRDAINGFNRLRDTGFSNLVNWSVGYSSGVTATPLSRIIDSATGKAMLRSDATVPSGSDRYVFLSSGPVSASAGERLAVQGFVQGVVLSGTASIAGCVLVVSPRDSSGAFLGNIAVALRGGSADPLTHLADFCPSLPSGTAQIYLSYEVRLIDGAAGTVRVALAEPMVSSARVGQTEYPPYSPGVTDGADGVPGNDGLPGPPGADGLTQRIHFAYADSADGTVNFTTGAAGGRYYVGTLVDFVVADSTNPADYTWSVFRGADGANGTPGAPGANGQPTYVHIAYANSADGTADFHLSDPTGRAYVGLYVDTTVADSTNPALYSWSLIKGADALSLSALPPSVTVPCTYGGTPKAALPSVQLKALKGTADVTGSAAYTIAGSGGLAGLSVSSAGLVTMSGIVAEEAWFEISATQGGSASNVRVNYTKSLDGAPYSSAPTVYPGVPTTTTLQTVGTSSLLAGPNGTMAIDANGYFETTSGSTNVAGSLEISLNGGSSWTSLGALTTYPSLPGEPGGWYISVSVSGASIGLTTKLTVMVRLQMRKTNTNNISDGGGVLNVSWSG
jgi:hypothetical protein